jgi:hypothetical protein
MIKRYIGIFLKVMKLLACDKVKKLKKNKIVLEKGDNDLDNLAENNGLKIYIKR